jgi:hypothetical protein
MDEGWTAEAGPHIVTQVGLDPRRREADDRAVRRGARLQVGGGERPMTTLTIEPGVVLRSAPGTAFEVEHDTSDENPATVAVVSPRATASRTSPAVRRRSRVTSTTAARRRRLRLKMHATTAARMRTRALPELAVVDSPDMRDSLQVARPRPGDQRGAVRHDALEEALAADGARVALHGLTQVDGRSGGGSRRGGGLAGQAPVAEVLVNGLTGSAEPLANSRGRSPRSARAPGIA